MWRLRPSRLVTSGPHLWHLGHLRATPGPHTRTWDTWPIHTELRQQIEGVSFILIFCYWWREHLLSRRVFVSSMARRMSHCLQNITVFFFFFLDLALCGLLLGLGIFCAVVTREDIEVFTPFKMWLLSYKKLMAAVFVVQQPRFIMGFNGRKDYENGGIV